MQFEAVLEERRYRLSPRQLLKTAEAAHAAWTEGLLVASGKLREVVNSVGMKLVLVPAGRFTMGSPASEKERGNEEGPQHGVEITRAFYLGTFPVTQEQFRRVLGTNPSHFAAEGGGRDQVKRLDTRSFPVERVSWEEAVAFCHRLSEMPEEKSRKRTYRLPTEAEWEHACRAGATGSTPFSFGASLSSAQANCNGTYPYGGGARGPYLERTSAVGSFPSNAWGLFDMHGNVWEWCSDWFDLSTYATGANRDPAGPPAGKTKVLRGGSWGDIASRCRSAYRNRIMPASCGSSIGFRVVMVAG
jgi:formylglycine-generating enzyme required for sulfatase activity